MSVGLSKKTSTEWIRFKDGLWIPHRKRTYLYWFKFLQEAEHSAEHKVKWNQYKGWGGSNAVLGMKFDEWWNDRWKDLFGVEGKGVPQSKQKYPLTTTQPKTEALRMSLLVYQCRNTPPDLTERDRGKDVKPFPRRGGKTLAIARKVIQIEKRKATPLWQIDPDAGAGDGRIENEFQSSVGRYLRRAKKIIENVCEGNFP